MKLIKQEEVDVAVNEYADKIQSYSGSGAFKAGIGFAEKEFSKLFPNGFLSWIETFYEVVAKFYNSESKRLDYIENNFGRGGLWELAEELTNKFELLHKDREWDGEFYDEIDSFLEIELSKEY